MTDDGKHFARRLRAFGILPLHRATPDVINSANFHRHLHTKIKRSVFVDPCLDGPRRVLAQWRNSARAVITKIIIIIL